MSKRVYILKHATPKMKHQHMSDVLAWRANLKEQQAEYTGEGICPRCGKPIGTRPLFMQGKYDICYDCYYDISRQGLLPHPETNPVSARSST